jgi:hypothetical protein
MPARLAIWGAATIALALTLHREPAAAGWLFVPLALGAGAASLLPIGPAAAAGISVVMVAIAVAAGGYLPVGRLTPSIWDAAALATIVALGCATALRFDRDSRPAAAARAWMRWLGVPIVVGASTAVLLAFPLQPVRPPRALVEPVLAGVSVSDEAILCGPGPSVTCRWEFRVDSRGPDPVVVRDQLLDRLSRQPGWTTAQARSCHTWGWALPERACLTFELRDSFAYGALSTRAQYLVVVLTYT